MRPIPEYVPTPEQIREAAAEVRSGWTESVRRKRAGESMLSSGPGLHTFRMPRVVTPFSVDREFLRDVENAASNPMGAG